VQAFVQRDYPRCVELCGEAMEASPRARVFGLPWQLLFISMQRSGVGQAVEPLAAKFLATREPMVGHLGTGMNEWFHFENELVRVTLGQKSLADVLPLARIDAQRCQAHFYAGARLLTLGQREEARQEFDACLAVPCDSVERELAEAEKASLTAG
jgi:hypothetical protein